MGLVARQQREVDPGCAGWNVDPLAAVLDREDVDALLGDELEQPQKLARPVRHPGANDEMAAGGGDARAATP